MKLERCGYITAKAQVILCKSWSLLDSKWTCSQQTASFLHFKPLSIKHYPKCICIKALFLRLHLFRFHVLYPCKDFTQSVKTETSALIVLKIKHVNVKYHSTKILAQVERCQNYNVQTPTKLYYYYEMTSELHSVNCSWETDW